VERLTNIRTALLSELSHNHARFLFLNTRLILSIGVDLNNIPRALDSDPTKVRLALETLGKMGFLQRKEARRGS
jgi:predicted transcriptional regulator with HTH domain